MVHDASFHHKKVVRPTLPSILLHRKALIAQLQASITPEQYKHGASTRYKLFLCCAPAGYGKTTLLADFAHSQSLPCCWYFLDHTDTDPVVFLRTLLASIRQAFPTFTFSLFPELPFLTASSYHATIDALCIAIAAEISERFLLMLCNYEEINESEVLTDLVTYLLKKLPDQVTLVIESRVIPDISFASFVIHDEMCGLHSNALRFSSQEITELASLQGLPPLTPAEAEQLATSFDGWIAGILLGTRVGDARFQLLQQQASREDVSLLPHEYSPVKGKRTTLLTYVVDEVLKRDKTAYAFLQTISILQQIEPSICNALLNINDAAEQLAHLESQGFFVTSYKSLSGTTYSLHPVIRDLLSAQLRSQEPERFLALHRYAATLWQASENAEQALYHALKSEAYDLATVLISNNAERLFQQGQQETLIRWLHTLPTEIQEHHPQLLLLQASIFLEHGQHSAALPLLEKAEALLPDQVEGVNPRFHASIAILRGKAFSQMGNYLQAQELCQEALTYIPEQDHILRAAAEMRLGVCASLQGDFTSGIQHLQQALRIWNNEPPLNQAIEIHSSLANTYYFIGNFPLAQHHLVAMMNACEQLQDISGKIRALTLQGLISQDRGLASEAEASFLQVLTLTNEPSYMQRGKAYALVNLSLFYVEQGTYAQALAHAQNGLGLARQFGNRSLVNAALSSLALSYLFLGDAVSALFMVEQMETQATSEETVGYEHAWRDLTYGLVLLKQGRSFEATTRLSHIETVLRSTSLKRELLQAKIRLAACHVEQGQIEQAVQLLGEVATLLSTHHTYTHLVQIELQWLPGLLPILQNHPYLAPLRTLLNIAEPLQHQKQPQPTAIKAELTNANLTGLTIYAFGEPTVLLNGQPVKRWRMNRTMELFFFLLDARHPMSKESILTVLWPEYDEQTNQTFHNTLYYLRKLLGESCVVFQPSGYSLNLAAVYGEQVWYDVHIFQQRRSEAEQALAREYHALAKESLLEMVQLYRGDYGRPFYSDWCTFRRDELRTAYLEARRQLAQIAWNAEAWNESTEHWRQMLHMDNCLEEAHYGLIRCYARQGKRQAALRQYQTCQKLLQEELGVQPGQAMQHLYQRLLNPQNKL
ncbi:hypothetical protein KSD_30730 [Ktedonobacter sp. SOSP1-85]|uniref:BTAD domain-containing putative transcriptional regulator n=1 Tax=Ktedonobacter sp. SOSP1-85 TaxID=2778367 RepID=UPI001916A2F7|nr:BTAD domain-containing putative transcriptional regulator [Ktedonobacter sp. SOSP1-85]GHO75302.1 hypothetical protein KSD_30730 [Ktedonobacter sp. SOSP1-85]